MGAGRALITGITGQDGSYLAELLLSESYEVWGAARSPEAAEHPNLAAIRGALPLIRAELSDPASVRAAIFEAQPTEIYHLAAPTFVPDSWRNPARTMAQIAGGTAAVLAAARDLDTPARVCVASSAEVFGDAGESPQRETTPMRPRTPYGVAKLAAHGLVGVLRSQGLFACSAILYNHESPRRPESFVPRKVTRGAAAIALGLEDTLSLGDLATVRDWSHAADVVRAMWLALQAAEPSDYVVASGVGRTVRELVDAAFSAAGIEPDGRVVVDPSFVRGPEPVQLIGDPSRARDVLGWEPRHSFEDTIGEMIGADLALLRAAVR